MRKQMALVMLLAVPLVLKLLPQRLQAASKHTHADLKYSGTYDAVRTIWQKEGEACCMELYLLELACCDCACR